MPISNDADKGSESNGAKSTLYCKFCYAGGAFINPAVTVEQMKNIIVAQMKKSHQPHLIIQQSLHMLPGLKRWKGNDTT